MKRRKLVLSTRAKQDLGEGIAWLRERNPQAAAKLREIAYRKLESLRDGAERCAVADDVPKRFGVVRRLLFGTSVKWRAYFALDEDSVTVLHIRHGARDDWTG